MKKLIFIFLAILSCFSVSGQNSDDHYAVLLEEVLKEIENRYHVKLEYRKDLVEGLWLTNAYYRFRPGFEKTMTNVLKPFDLAYKQSGEQTYRISSYRYSEMPVEDGRELLAFLSGKYTILEEWEQRRSELKSCMLESLFLSPMPEPTGTPPIITNRRSYDSYVVENIA
ncbi:MAG TPA: acetylxylan esterase, partial [Bacteroidaceae bacterium]|nr:acetylxylan esterase [Bacteroidaceae bacterium]